MCFSFNLVIYSSYVLFKKHHSQIVSLLETKMHLIHEIVDKNHEESCVKIFFKSPDTYALRLSNCHFLKLCAVKHRKKLSIN